MDNHQAVKRHFRKVDPIIYAVMKDLNFADWLKPRIKKRTSRGYFMALCREIIGQQLSGKVADVILTRFKGLFTSKIIKPQDVLKLSDQTLRDVGMSWAKVKYVKDLAQKTLTNEVAFSKLHTFEDEAVALELMKVKGIGRWTAEMFLIFTLGREDVFSFGDLGLKKGLQKLYNKKSKKSNKRYSATESDSVGSYKLKPLSEKDISKIVSRWTPYKSYGSIALWHSLEP